MIKIIAKVMKLTICSAKEATAETIKPALRLLQVSPMDRQRRWVVRSGGMGFSGASVAAAGAVGAGVAASWEGTAGELASPPEAARADTRREAGAAACLADPGAAGSERAPLVSASRVERWD